MPPQDIEANITAPLERFFTLASGIDHMESHSMLGVSMIRVFFQPEHQRRCRRHASSPISRWPI